jgi:hypothetical protein
MTDKQLYTLCGVISLSAGVAANASFLKVWAALWFLCSILFVDKKQ